MPGIKQSQHDEIILRLDGLYKEESDHIRGFIRRMTRQLDPEFDKETGQFSTFFMLAKEDWIIATDTSLRDDYIPNSRYSLPFFEYEVLTTYMPRKSEGIPDRLHQFNVDNIANVIHFLNPGFFEEKWP